MILYFSETICADEPCENKGICRKIGAKSKCSCADGRQILLYEGHPISSDNGLISQELLSRSELFCQLNVAIGIAYLCLKYGVLSQPDLTL